MITNSAKELIQSNLILNCNEPIAIDDVSWLKPVKYIGIWWGMITGKWTWDEGFRHGATNERSKKYIDFAAKHGFDEVLIEGWASGWQGLFPEDSVTVSFTKSTNDFDFDQIQTYARSKGISELRILFRHALRNALIPIVTVIGLQVGVLLSGAIITEAIFDWPGLGNLLISAINSRNYPLVQGCVLFIAGSYVMVNLVIDLLYAYLDPRIRLS